MAHTLVSNLVHLIFGTKGRMPQIPDQLQPAMWSYIDIHFLDKHGVKCDPRYLFD